MSTARQLIAAADRTELGVLLEELDPYFKANGHTTDWIDPTIREHVPEYADAHTQLKKADAAMQFTESAANMLKRGFDSGQAPSAQLLEKFNPHTAGRLPTDRRGTLPATNGGKYDPDHQ